VHWVKVHLQRQTIQWHIAHVLGSSQVPQKSHLPSFGHSCFSRFSSSRCGYGSSCFCGVGVVEFSGFCAAGVIGSDLSADGVSLVVAVLLV